MNYKVWIFIFGNKYIDKSDKNVKENGFNPVLISINKNVITINVGSINIFFRHL